MFCAARTSEVPRSRMGHRPRVVVMHSYGLGYCNHLQWGSRGGVQDGAPTLIELQAIQRRASAGCAGCAGCVGCVLGRQQSHKGPAPRSQLGSHLRSAKQVFASSSVDRVPFPLASPTFPGEIEEGGRGRERLDGRTTYAR